MRPLLSVLLTVGSLVLATGCTTPFSAASSNMTATNWATWSPPVPPGSGPGAVDPFLETNPDEALETPPDAESVSSQWEGEAPAEPRSGESG